jgi:hypothetical protein
MATSCLISIVPVSANSNLHGTKLAIEMRPTTIELYVNGRVEPLDSCFGDEVEVIWL